METGEGAGIGWESGLKAGLTPVEGGCKEVRWVTGPENVLSLEEFGEGVGDSSTQSHPQKP